jgi:hypothetical protein
MRQAGATPQLFDLDADISESKDLAPTQPERVAKLNATLEEWNSQLIKPLFEYPRPGGKK